MVSNRTGFGTPGQDEYRQKARRLRRIYQDHPVILQRKLEKLAAAKDEGSGKLSQESHRNGTPESAWWFAHRVAAMMDGPVLRYSKREALLRDAATMGIGRFEANLVIAVTQHKMRGMQAAPIRPRRRKWMGTAAVVAATQLVIGGIVWWILAG